MKRRNTQPGKQDHAEGEYGNRAREANRERIQTRIDDEDDTEGGGVTSNRPRDGSHRLREDRQQHDEADKNSEKNRLARDRDKPDARPTRPGRESR